MNTEYLHHPHSALSHKTGRIMLHVSKRADSSRTAYYALLLSVALASPSFASGADDFFDLVYFVGGSAVEYRNPLRGEDDFGHLIALIRSDDTFRGMVGTQTVVLLERTPDLREATANAMPPERLELCRLSLLTTGLSSLRAPWMASTLGISEEARLRIAERYDQFRSQYSYGSVAGSFVAPSSSISLLMGIQYELDLECLALLNDSEVERLNATLQGTSNALRIYLARQMMSGHFFSTSVYSKRLESSLLSLSGRHRIRYVAQCGARKVLERSATNSRTPGISPSGSDEIRRYILADAAASEFVFGQDQATRANFANVDLTVASLYGSAFWQSAGEETRLKLSRCCSCVPVGADLFFDRSYCREYGVDENSWKVIESMRAGVNVNDVALSSDVSSSPLGSVIVHKQHFGEIVRSWQLLVTLIDEMPASTFEKLEKSYHSDELFLRTVWAGLVVPYSD